MCQKVLSMLLSVHNAPRKFDDLRLIFDFVKITYALSLIILAWCKKHQYVAQHHAKSLHHMTLSILRNLQNLSEYFDDTDLNQVRKEPS